MGRYGGINEVILRVGRGLMLFVDLAIILLIVVLVGFAIVIILKDLAGIWFSWEYAGMEHLQIATNDVFFLIVFMEITRSVIVGRRRPEMYLVALAEVGFVVAIREIIAAVIVGSYTDLVLASVASLAMAVVLLIIYRYVLPHRTVTVGR